MEQRAAPNINILAFKEHDESSIGKFLTWSLKYGRIIIIITEFVVIAAFISRFYFDRILSDLHDRIDAETKFVEQTQKTEKDFLALQASLDQAGKIMDSRHDFAKFFQNFDTLKPADMNVKDIAVKEKDLSLTASVLTPGSLNSFLQSTVQSKWYTDISVDDLQVKDGQIVFSVSAKVEKAAFGLN